MASTRINAPHEVQVADEIVALLTLCQQLLSEKEGKEWRVPSAYSCDEDWFAERIRTACSYATQLRHLLPMMSCLSSVGAEMERRGEINVMTGESYSQRALEYLKAQYLSDSGVTP
ncbi:hypothetical protein JK158_21835 [Enterobacter sp. JGM127]|nr:hypothetical protein [Enterobacter sp. JGM127]